VIPPARRFLAQGRNGSGARQNYCDGTEEKARIRIHDKNPSALAVLSPLRPQLLTPSMAQLEFAERGWKAAARLEKSGDRRIMFHLSRNW
jgi:hypothetical protein